MMTSGDNGETVKTPLLKALKRLTIWTVVLYITMFLFIGVTYLVRASDLEQVERQSNRNTTAFCALRTDVENRMASSQEFLEEHPNGIPGISAEQIQQSIRAQRSTFRALDVVVCP
jgi:preprotein translocase subunit SecG